LQHRSTAFGPRFGFAYRIDSKTVIRAGCAIMYDSNREDGNADGGVQGFGGNYSVPSNYFSTGISMLLPSGQNNSMAGFLPFAAAIQAGTPPVVNPSIVNFASPSYFSDGKAAQFYDYNITLERTLTAPLSCGPVFMRITGNCSPARLQSTQSQIHRDLGSAHVAAEHAQQLASAQSNGLAPGHYPE
jgi:hypothetical protein